MMYERYVRPMIVAGAVTLVSLAGMAQPAAADVVAYWQFESGDVTADSSSNNHTLVNNGAVVSGDTAANAPGNGSVYFGGNDAMQTASELDLSGYTGLTIEWFMKPDTGATGMILEHSEAFFGTAGAFAAYIPANNASIVNGAHENSSTGYFIDSVSPASGWNHYAITIDSTQAGNAHVRFFVNYEEVGTSQETSASAYGFRNDDFYIGSRAGTSLFFSGLVDEVRISEGVLSPESFLGVPEPASLGFVGAGVVMMLMRRR